MPQEASLDPFAILEYERGIHVGHTKSGLSFLIIGILLSAVPIISSVGNLVAFIGIVLIILGRQAFGKAHSKSVFIAGAVFIIGAAFVVVSSIMFLMFVSSIPSPSSPKSWWGNSAIAEALIPHFSVFLVTGAIGTILTGIAFALFSFFLQRLPGRILLLIGAATSVAMSLLVFSVLGADVTSQIIPGDPPLLSACQNGCGWEVPWAFEGQVVIVGLLNLIPAIFYAAAYYLAYSRIP